MIWSASNSRHGSLHDLTSSQQATEQPAASTGTTNLSVHNKRRLDMADRAKTVVSLTREEERRGEADPYAWLSVTAPASPRHSLRELSSQISTDRESDPGSQQGSTIWGSRRSTTRKTRKATGGEGGHHGQEEESEGETSPRSSMSRTGSVAKLHKVVVVVVVVAQVAQGGEEDQVGDGKPRHGATSRCEKSEAKHGGRILLQFCQLLTV